jgi:FixJ family two-component response regulator
MRTVFVVDDDGLMREVLSRLLERSGYRVRGFQSPDHALPLIDSEYPYAIVSDVQMPGMTGLEFAERVRVRGITTPIILVTGAAIPDLSEQARRAGVCEIFEKPIKDADRFVSAVDHAVSRREDEERTAGLDHLRLSFLTGLAHELRTPLTAIKLALDSLFAVHIADRRSTEGRLLAIGQRNLDRIIRLVEGQLDLLEITLGDVALSRRFVSIRDLLERAVTETQPRVRRRVVIDPAGTTDHAFLFTDPDRLRAVVRYLLEATPFNDDLPVTVGYAIDAERQKIELRFGNVGLPSGPSGADIASNSLGSLEIGDEPSASTGVAVGNEGESSRGGVAEGPIGPTAPHARSIAAGDAFETRAFHRIIASLGGEIASDGGKDRCVCVRFPVSPRFDAREDFDLPIGSLREAAMLSGKAVSLVKCEVEHAGRDGSCFSAEEKEFFEKCGSALSEGDALVRGRRDGTYYLVLVERRTEEIDHIADFLRTAGASGYPVSVTVEPAPLPIWKRSSKPAWPRTMSGVWFGRSTIG